LGPTFMKKNGTPKGSGNNGSGGAAENLRNRKTYLNPLEEMRLDEPPAIRRGKMPGAIEWARVAAALEKDSTSEVSAGPGGPGAGDLESIGGRTVRRGDGGVFLTAPVAPTEKHR
jgi:hypothetical protein